MTGRDGCVLGEIVPVKGIDVGDCGSCCIGSFVGFDDGSLLNDGASIGGAVGGIEGESVSNRFDDGSFEGSKSGISDGPVAMELIVGCDD